jgi:hypothetical protein
VVTMILVLFTTNKWLHASMIIHAILEHICFHALRCFSLVLTWFLVSQVFVVNFSTCVGHCWFVTGFHPWLSLNLRSSFCSGMSCCGTGESTIFGANIVFLNLLVPKTLSIKAYSRDFARELRSPCTFPKVRIGS